MRAAFDAANRRDLDAAVAPFRPDVEFTVLAAVDGPVVHRGVDAVRAFFASVWANWAETFSTANHVEEIGDCLLLETQDRRVGRDGIVVTGSGVQVWRFAGDEVVAITGYPGREQALQAL